MFIYVTLVHLLLNYLFLLVYLHYYSIYLFTTEFLLVT